MGCPPRRGKRTAPTSIMVRRGPTEDVEIRIRRFDPKKMKPYSVCLFLGKRNTGKSFLLKDILYHSRRIYPAGNVISETDHLTHHYDDFIPGMLIHRSYDPSILDNLFTRQEKARKEGWQHPGAFLVMDDCFADKKWQSDPMIRKVFLEGRHFLLFFALATQEVLGLPPALRLQTDYVFILRNNILEERRKLHKHYCGMMDFETFESVMQSCTENYGCLVVDNLTQSNKLEDQIFYYKAEPHDGIKICHEQFWAVNAADYVPRPSSGPSVSSGNGTGGSRKSHSGGNNNNSNQKSNGGATSHSDSLPAQKNKKKDEYNKGGRRITIVTK